MVSWLRIVWALAIVALGVALTSSPLAARELEGLPGSAMRVVTSLTEPAALLVWGTALACLAHFVRRRSSSK